MNAASCWKLSGKFLVGGFLLAFVGCSTSSSGGRISDITDIGVKENDVPGTVNYQWVEPMYDTVDVPGAISKDRTYYRARHKTIYEIRPERYQEVQY